MYHGEFKPGEDKLEEQREYDASLALAMQLQEEEERLEEEERKRKQEASDAKFARSLAGMGFGAPAVQQGLRLPRSQGSKRAAVPVLKKKKKVRWN